MTRTEFQELAEVRIAEAEALLSAGKWDGAYYLAGYAVECALKACTAKLTRPDEFPDRDRAVKAWTHKLDDLLTLAQLKTALEADAAVAASWDLVKGWRESSRYERKSEAVSRELCEAINDPTNGVLQWIRARW